MSRWSGRSIALLLLCEVLGLRLRVKVEGWDFCLVEVDLVKKAESCLSSMYFSFESMRSTISGFGVSSVGLGVLSGEVFGAKRGGLLC